MAHRRKLIAGNWKMNGTRAALADLAEIAAALRSQPLQNADVLICPPATILREAVQRGDGTIAIGAQDCHHKAKGAHTGDVSAEMIRDAGASHVIIGHSERRTDHAETSLAVADKVKGAWSAGLIAVICIGETQGEKDAGRTLELLSEQIEGSIPGEATPENSVLAYEPVWAIGTGRTPTVAEVGETHAFIRGELRKRFGDAAAAEFRILYGGSVKASNAQELLAIEDVDGALVGGASLKAADFLPICRAA